MIQSKKVLKRRLIILTKKLPNTNALVKENECNKKITEIENKIPSATGLETIAVSIQMPQMLKKYLILLIWTVRLLSIQKPQILKTNNLIPQVLILPLNLIN